MMLSIKRKFTLKSVKATIESIDSLMWIVLLAATPLFILIQPEQSWILLLLPFTWLISVVARKQPIPSTPMNLALLVIAIQVLISLYATYDIAVSLQKVTGVIWGMAVFFSLVRFGKKRTGILISTLVFIIGSAGIAFLGLLGIEWPTNKIIIFNSLYDKVPNISSILPGLTEGFHPNEVGGALTWIIPFWIVIFFWLVIRFKKIKESTPSFIILLGLLLNFSFIGVEQRCIAFQPIPFCLYRVGIWTGDFVTGSITEENQMGIHFPVSYWYRILNLLHFEWTIHAVCQPAISG